MMCSRVINGCLGSRIAQWTSVSLKESFSGKNGTGSRSITKVQSFLRLLRFMSVSFVTYRLPQMG